MGYQAFEQASGKWCARQFCTRIADYNLAFHHGTPKEDGTMGPPFWTPHLPVIGPLIEADTPEDLQIKIKAQRMIVWA